MRIQEFDRKDPVNLGRPNCFDVDQYLDCVEQMISADETTTALYMLDHMPGWYRDHIPVKAVNLKKALYRQFFTTLDYAENGTQASEMSNAPKEVLIENMQNERGYLTNQIVERFNSQGVNPHIFELGPGSYWLPYGLKALGRRFTYFGPSLNPYLQKAAAEGLEDHWQEKWMKHHPSIFICYEMIEHLSDPSEIYHHYVKSDLEADVILLSTPKYTFGGGMPDWQDNPLGHLRTYTPREFTDFATRHWPTHRWTIYAEPVMCLVGERQ